MAKAKTRTMHMKQEAFKGFTRVEDPLELHRLMLRAIDSHVPVHVQSPNAEKWLSKIGEGSSIEAGLVLEVPPELKDVPADGTEVMVIAFLKGQLLLCIQGSNSEWKDGILKVRPEFKVFKLQRRKEPRFDIPLAYELYTSFAAVDGERKRVKRRVLDVSEHGMAFLVESKRESEYYKPGLFIRKMEVIIENRQIFFDSRVAGAFPLRDRPQLSGIKVGLEIIRINPVDAQFLASYVARGLVQFAT